MEEGNPIFQRVTRLLGKDFLERLQQTRIILFGVGGVGSWCAESLIRTGIGHLTIVDNDSVNITNINRQLMATVSTVKKVKVVVLKERLLDINPDADIIALQKFYSEETANDFVFDNYDYVIDAIDSLKEKQLLILRATQSKACFFSSMGAALKIDPTRIQVADFWKVKGCPLAAALRHRFKKQGVYPARKFRCVFSDELLKNLGENEEPLGNKAQINGSLSHITATFGFTLAGLVIKDMAEKQ